MKVKFDMMCEAVCANASLVRVISASNSTTRRLYNI